MSSNATNCLCPFTPVHVLWKFSVYQGYHFYCTGTMNSYLLWECLVHHRIVERCPVPCPMHPQDCTTMCYNPIILSLVPWKYLDTRRIVPPQCVLQSHRPIQSLVPWEYLGHLYRIVPPQCVLQSHHPIPSLVSWEDLGYLNNSYHMELVVNVW